MINPELQHIANTIYMREVFGSYTKNAGFVDSAISGITEYIKSKYDPENPVTSIFAFLVPGVLFRASPVLGILYEVAEAFGFNWTEFWVSVKDHLAPHIEDAAKSGKQISDSVIQNAVETSLSSNVEETSSSEDMSNIKDLAKKFPQLSGIVKTQSLQNDIRDGRLIIRKAILLNASSKMIKTAGPIGSFFRSKLFPLFKRVFVWLFTTVLRSLGLAIAGGAAATMLGTTKSKEQDRENAQAASHQQAMQSLKNPNLSSDYTAIHPNDFKTIWILPGSISNIENILISWAQDVYPSLTDINAFHQSQAFNKTINLFKTRNKGASTLDIISVPPPFETKLDIVNTFAGDVLKHIAQPQSTNSFTYA